MIYKGGGDSIGGNFPREQFSWGKFWGVIFTGRSFHRGGIFIGGHFLGGNFLRGNFPDTLSGSMFFMTHNSYISTGRLNKQKQPLADVLQNW